MGWNRKECAGVCLLCNQNYIYLIYPVVREEVTIHQCYCETMNLLYFDGVIHRIDVMKQ